MSIVVLLSGFVARVAERPLRWLCAVAAFFAVDLVLHKGAFAGIFDLVHTASDETHHMLDVAVSVLIAAALVRVLWLARRLAGARSALRERAENLDLALANITQGLAAFDAEGNLRFANRQYYALYRLDAAQFGPSTHIVDLLKARKDNGSFAGEPDKYFTQMRMMNADGVPTRSVMALPDGRHISLSRVALPGGGWVTTHDDVSEQVKLRTDLQNSQRFLENIIDALPTAVAVKSTDDLRYHLVNAAFEELTGRTRDSVLNQAPADIYTLEDSEEVERLDYMAINGDAAVECVNTHLHTPDGLRRTMASRRKVLFDTDGKPEFLLAMFDDVTEREKISDALQESKQFLASVVDEIPIAVLVKNADGGRYVLCNREAEKFVGHARDVTIGKKVEELGESNTIRDVLARDRIALASPGKVLTAEVPFIREGQEPGLMLTRRVAIGPDANSPRYIVATYDDITDRRQNESRLAYLAYHDALTRLPNRSAFINSLEQMIDSCIGTHEQFAILSVDLDRFKEINDVCGHELGDELLGAVAQRIQIAAQGAVVARLSGDEFGLIIDGEQPEAGRALAQRLIETMKEEFVIDGQTVRASLTCGLSVFPSDGLDAATLLANADAALHRAKDDARGSMRFFEAEMDQRLRQRRALHHDLGAAIKNGEILLHYQPQTDANGEFVGFESLVRWAHPLRGMVSPGEFIPVAEESGLIVELGEWVLREACREAAGWAKPLQIAVNLSPVQFQHGDLVGLVHSILLETGLAPSRLELEITEGVLIRDFDRGLSLLRRLKALGVKIAMDDFGSGYSSLAYLQAFPFDKIKIDRDFVMNLGRNHQSAAIVRAVIGLGHGLNVPIVAEGVETQDQLAFLIAESCDQFQGYFLGKPAPIVNYASSVGLSTGSLAAMSQAG